MDPHKILGVKPGADEKEIKAAYHRLAKEHHPDVNGGSKEAETKFKQINEAYSLLTGKQQQSSSSSPPGFDPENFEDFFSETIFSQMFRGAASQSVNRVPVDPEVLIKGGTFAYTIQTLGKRNGRLGPIQKTINITIEPDSPVGTRIAVPDTEPNHVFLEFFPVDTKKYRVVNGFNLCETHNIDVFQAMAGTTIEVTAPGGKRLSIKVPPGTQEGSTHAVRGHGLRHVQGMRGNYLVQFKVSIPVVQSEEDLLNRFRAAKKSDEEKNEPVQQS